MQGDINFFCNTLRGDKPMEQFFVGASYTAGPFTVGANAFWGRYAGSRAIGCNAGTGGFAADRQRNASRRGQRRYGLVASAPTTASRRAWTSWPSAIRHAIHEPGVRPATPGPTACRTALRANVFILGTRLAF